MERIAGVSVFDLWRHASGGNRSERRQESARPPTIKKEWAKIGIGMAERAAG